MSGDYKSEWFLMIHYSSGKQVHPYGGQLYPPDGTKLIVHRPVRPEDRLLFRFVQIEGHYGYIEHKSNKILHAKGDSFNPGNGTLIELDDDRNASCLFAIAQDQERIYHCSGALVQPKGAAANPPNDTDVVVDKNADESAKWTFVSLIGRKVDLYPKPNLSGRWEIAHAVINPLAEHTYELKYEEGRSQSTTNTRESMWEVSVGVAFDLFSMDTKFSSVASETETSTWDTRLTRTATIQVKPGKSVYTWQWVYYMEQWGDTISFQSNILKDTDRNDVSPML